MRIFVTGIGGFIAGHLAAHLRADGHIVFGSTSRPVRDGSEARIRHWKLGDSVDESLIGEAEVVVHCAHDFTPRSLQRNVEGTLALAELARKQGVVRQFFMSSLSARPDARTEYGKAKFETESEFLRLGDIVVRPGTALGPGGLFGRIAGLVARLPAVPLLDGGRTPMTVIGIHDLCRALSSILRERAPAEFNLYYPEKITLRELLETLCRQTGRRVALVPVPSALLLPPLILARTLGIKLPLDVENLKGFLRAQEPVHASNLESVLGPSAPIESVLRESLGGEPVRDR